MLLKTTINIHVAQGKPITTIDNCIVQRVIMSLFLITIRAVPLPVTQLITQEKANTEQIDTMCLYTLATTTQMVPQIKGPYQPMMIILILILIIQRTIETHLPMPVFRGN